MEDLIKPDNIYHNDKENVLNGNMVWMRGKVCKYLFFSALNNYLISSHIRSW